MWHGIYPPQAIFSRRRFRKILLNPPKFEPGSWCGAGKLWFDPWDEEFLLTSRPRSAESRGYALEIYRSRDGENYSLIWRINKEEIESICNQPVQSIEGTQILRDPLTGRYMLYISVDVSERRWETYLMSADDPSGPWIGEGFALRRDKEYDSAEARDPTIDIVDGKYICLYKARAEGSRVVRTALALSRDGKSWVKMGVPTVDGREQPNYLLLYGSIMAGCNGPTLIGTATREVVKDAALTDTFAAYTIDYRRLNLETIFEAKWKPGSIYEHPTYPIHTYAGVACDSPRGRWLMWIEAVDPTTSKEPGLNLEVDRLLLYISSAKGV
ncbi:MAG: hypothetical protein QXF59_06675 [Candidatus Bathyarchaeia archaeon]|nr:hypothetical protein [Candidatus Bathyarchaeota archaeon]